MKEPKEYKPGFKGWLFAIFLAAGFGNLLADTVRNLIVAVSEEEAMLVLRDKQCTKVDQRMICNFYLENVGDKVAYITKATMVGDDHPTFYTSHPFEVSEDDAKKPVQRAHVAVVSPNSLVLIALNLPLTADTSGEACFFKGDVSLACI